MKLIIPIIACILSSFLIASCIGSCETEKCYYVSNSGVTWAHYDKENDTFYFATKAGDRDTLIIDKVVHSDYYIIEKKAPFCSNEKCVDPHATISSKVDDAHPNWLPMTIGDVQAEEFQLFTMNFKGAIIKLKIYYGTSKQNVYTTLANIDDYDIYDLEFFSTAGSYPTKELEITTKDKNIAQVQGIDKLYLKGRFGIIGYRTYPDLKEYWIQ